MALTAAVIMGGSPSYVSAVAQEKPPPEHGTVVTRQGGPLHIRAEANTNPGTEVVGNIPAGTVVKLACHVTGQSVTGPFGTSTIWNRIADGQGFPVGYLADSHLFTGSDDPVVPGCADTTASSPSEGALYHELLTWVSTEMAMNADLARAKRKECDERVIGRGFACRTTWWYDKVRGGHEWDHKAFLKNTYFANTVRSSQRYSQVPGADAAVNFDVWSNIHYGYVGTVLGISRGSLQTFADAGRWVPGAGRNDAGDRLAVDIGVDLARSLQGSVITAEAVDLAIRDRLSELDNTGTGIVIRAHDCATVEPTNGGLPHCEGPWDFSMVYAGEELRPGTNRSSIYRRIDNGTTVTLVMQDDGNLVLYNESSAGRRVCWASNTVGRGVYAVYQLDGNFVVYGAPGTDPPWSTRTKGHDSTDVRITGTGAVAIGERTKLNERCE
jgi:uncharacterized protein YraI